MRNKLNYYILTFATVFLIGCRTDSNNKKEILADKTSLIVDTIYWYPETIANQEFYVMELDSIPLQEVNIFVIEDAIRNIKQEDLLGLEFIDIMN